MKVSQSEHDTAVRALFEAAQKVINCMRKNGSCDHQNELQEAIDGLRESQDLKSGDERRERG